MALATVQDVEKAYAGRSVLKGISFDLQKGQRIGLVGPNGAGKTTLLKLLAGIEQVDHGQIIVAKTCKLSYVSQVARLDPEETLHHQVSLVFEEVHALETALHKAGEDLARYSAGPEHEEAMERYSRIEHEFNHLGGYDYQHRVESVLNQLKFTERDLDLPIKALSGGQKSRAQLARFLLEAPDLALLDEPTNHLDLPMLDWLEETLNAMTDTTLLIVSHDRYFLDSVADEIYDMQDGRIEQYPGNYSAFTTLKTERQLAQQRAYDQQQSYIAKQEEFIRRFSAGQRAMQAKGRKTRLERLKDESLVGRVQRNTKRVILNLEVKKASGIDVLKAEGLAKSFPEKKLFEALDLHIERGSRLGIIGANGTGKSTLLNILAGDMLPDAGKMKWGYGVNVQFYRQEQQDLNPDNTILEELQTARITATQQELRDLAALFLFSGDNQEKRISVLSGGEKARVAIARLLMNTTNTILIDEPTNHLDMHTCEVLEEALDSYDGTLILVSHDRYFLDQVCDGLLVLQGDGAWKLYKGSYTDYLAAVAKEKEKALAAKRDAERAERQRAAEAENRKRAQQKAAARREQRPKVPFKYQKASLKDIEIEIAEAEQTVSALEQSFAEPKVATHPEAMRKLQTEYAKAKASVAELMKLWEIKADESAKWPQSR
jgi:ATP-binding cassette, subfamily F, member 3